MMSVMRCLVLYLLIVASASAANDLSPVGPDDMDGYYSTVRKVLIGEREILRGCWMISRPSFQPEYAVLFGADDDGPNVIARRAKLQIWAYKEVNANEMVLALRSDVGVEGGKRAIAVGLKDRIDKLWIETVKRARYPAEEDMGLDGITYEFHAPVNYYGETWSPRDGIAKALVDLCETLFAYAMNEKNAPTEKDIVARLDKLEAELTTAGEHLSSSNKAEKSKSANP